MRDKDAIVRGYQKTLDFIRHLDEAVDDLADIKACGYEIPMELRDGLISAIREIVMLRKLIRQEYTYWLEQQL